jgi:hypothetical protein
MDIDFNLGFAGLTLARLALALSPLAKYVQDDQLLASPLTAYSRRRSCIRLSWSSLMVLPVQEGLFLSQKGIDPYSGDTFHHVRRQAPFHITPILS